MPAAPYDLTIEQGATYTLRVRFGTLLVDNAGAPVLDGDGNQQLDEGRDFTNCTFRAQIRKGRKPTADVLCTLTSEDAVGGITGDADGNVVVIIPDEVTDTVDHNGYWDLKVYNTGGTEDRLLEGVVVVTRAVTVDAAP